MDHDHEEREKSYTEKFHHKIEKKKVKTIDDVLKITFIFPFSRIKSRRISSYFGTENKDKRKDF